VVVLDPKGDAADAAVSAVPERRVCTLLDLGRPTCGFNPLAVHAPPDTIADFVVAALRQLFGEGDIRASSDRYLRNAIIAVLACDASASLWDVARLLSVGDDGRAYRESIGRRLLELPQYSEVAAFFAGELGVQLADARAATTAKLDAPANKLARVLNSTSIVGNLTRDPELRASASGTSVCGLRVACNTRRRKAGEGGEGGDWEDRANYFDVTVFGGQAESCARYLNKGRQVAIDGRLEWREWKNADGQHREAVSIVAESVQFLGAPPAATPAESNGAEPVAVGAVADDDGELAF
jgi:single-strand DNA-binding protein